MNFIFELNAFERYVETNYIPASAQLLWYKMISLFNKSGWPEWIQVENQRLMAMIQVKRESTFIELRRHLIDCGLLEYQKGRKGYPNKYKLLSFKNIDSSGVQTEAENGVKTEVQSVVQTEVQTADINKNININKTKKIKTPLSPQKVFEEIWSRYSFDEQLAAKVKDWLTYKGERGSPYKQAGLVSLLTTIQNRAQEYGQVAVAELIEISMANNWQGIAWDKLKRQGAVNYEQNSTTDSSGTRRKEYGLVL